MTKFDRKIHSRNLNSYNRNFDEKHVVKHAFKLTYQDQIELDAIDATIKRYREFFTIDNLLKFDAELFKELRHELSELRFIKSRILNFNSL